MKQTYFHPCVERISLLLKEQGKTQKDLCKYIPISINSFMRWKKGESTSYENHIVKISEYLGVTPDYILCIDSQDKEILDELKKLSGSQKDMIITEIHQLVSVK